MKLFNQKPKIEFVEDETSEFVVIFDQEKPLPFEQVFIDPETKLEYTKPIINPIIFSYMSDEQQQVLHQQINLFYKKQEIFKIIINNDEDLIQTTLIELNSLQLNLPIKQFMENEICSNLMDYNKTQYLDNLLTDQLKIKSNSEKDLSIISNILLCIRYNPSDEYDLFDHINTYCLKNYSNSLKHLQVVFVNGLSDCGKVKKFFDIKNIQSFEERYISSNKHFLFIVRPAIVQNQRHDYLFIISNNRLDDIEQLQLIYQGICNFFDSQIAFVSDSNILLKKNSLYDQLKILLSNENCIAISGQYKIEQQKQSILWRLINQQFENNSLEKLLYHKLGLQHHNPYFSIYNWGKAQEKIKNYIESLCKCDSDNFQFLKSYGFGQQLSGETMLQSDIIGNLIENSEFDSRMKLILSNQKYLQQIQNKLFQTSRINLFFQAVLFILITIYNIVDFLSPALNFYLTFNYIYLLQNYFSQENQLQLGIEYITIIFHQLIYSFLFFVAFIFAPDKIIIKKKLKQIYCKKSVNLQEIDTLDEKQNLQINQSFLSKIFGSWEELTKQNFLNENEKQQIINDPESIYIKSVNVIHRINSNKIYQYLFQILYLVDLLLLAIEITSLVINFGIQYEQVNLNKQITFILQIFLILFTTYPKNSVYQLSSEQMFVFKFTNLLQNIIGILYNSESLINKLNKNKEIGTKFFVNFFIITLLFSPPFIFKNFDSILFYFSIYMISVFILSIIPFIQNKIANFKNQSQPNLIQFQSFKQYETDKTFLNQIIQYEDTYIKLLELKKSQEFQAQSKQKVEQLMQKQEDIVQFMNTNKILGTSPQSSTRIKQQFLESSKISHQHQQSLLKDFQGNSHNVSQIGLLNNIYTTRSQV